MGMFHSLHVLLLLLVMSMGTEQQDDDQRQQCETQVDAAEGALALVQRRSTALYSKEMETQASESVESSVTGKAELPQLLSMSNERKCGIVWFYHIPKCGGEAVNWWLFRMKERGQFDDVLLLHNMTEEINYTAFYEDRISSLLEKPQGKLVAVHHHDRGPGLHDFGSHFAEMKAKLQASGCDLYRMTFLRKPESLLRSTLVFYDSAEHQPGYEWVAPEPVRYEQNQAKRLKLALDTDKIYDNMMVRYLLNNRGEYDGPNPRNGGAKYPMEIGGVNETALQEATSILKSFEFVGFTEEMAGGVETVARFLGLRDIVELPHRNVYGVDQANMAANTAREALSDEVVSMMQPRISMDTRLYETALQRRRKQSAQHELFEEPHI